MAAEQSNPTARLADSLVWPVPNEYVPLPTEWIFQ